MQPAGSKRFRYAVETITLTVPGGASKITHADSGVGDSTSMQWTHAATALAAIALLPCTAEAQKVADHNLALIAIDPATVSTPELRFTETDTDKAGYEKYFYFVREGTDFATAYQDIRECDALARGMRFYAGGGAVPYPYAGTLGGAVGGAIGSAMVDMIFGSSVRRQMRRTNLRTCMGYKGYGRYGLSKDIWEAFNFEEGNRVVPEDERQKYLQMQAKAAISGRPATQELEF
jgi:hypothetical protein